MTHEKFNDEINTLKTFFELYCENKHEDLIEKRIDLTYKEHIFVLNLNLCKSCHADISYSFEKLQNCPHEIKPRCRKCSNPCYEKPRWKHIAKIMIYSTMSLSLSKIRNRVKKILS